MDKDKLIRDAQFRKGLSIAYFNSLNCAIDLVTRNIEAGALTDEQVVERVMKVRDIFIDQHNQYYAGVISKVGKNYDPQKAIEKLNTATTLAELSEKWILLSQDERQDEAVRKVASELKNKYANS